MKAFNKRVMQIWLPASDALLEMMIFHLPSPAKAQKYRVENLYVGPLGDFYANAIRNYDPEGELHNDTNTWTVVAESLRV